MSLFRRELSTYSGKGELKSKNGELSGHIRFRCSQLFDGSIEGMIVLLEGSPLNFFNARRDFSFNIEGETENERNITIDGVHLHKLYLGEQKGQETRDMDFSANAINLNVGSFESANPEVMLEYGITCLDPFRVSVNTSLGNIVFAELKECESAIEEIKAHENACLTSIAQLKLQSNIIYENLTEYIDSTKNTIRQVLDLTSLAQGIFQDWMYCRVCEKFEQEYKIIFIQHRAPRTKLMRPRWLIHKLTLRDFLQRVYPNYTEDLRLETGMSWAIEWYLESLSSGLVLESKYMLGFICLELLVDKFEKLTNRERILDIDAFEEFSEKLRRQARDILQQMNVDSAKRAGIYSGLKGINRYSFTDSLVELLRRNGVGYSDLSNDLGNVSRVRNKIAHKGLTALPFDELYGSYTNMMVLIQRILLSMLKYDGQFINWSNNFNVDTFKSNPRSD